MLAGVSDPPPEVAESLVRATGAQVSDEARDKCCYVTLTPNVELLLTPPATVYVADLLREHAFWSDVVVVLCQIIWMVCCGFPCCSCRVLCARSFLLVGCVGSVQSVCVCDMGIIFEAAFVFRVSDDSSWGRATRGNGWVFVHPRLLAASPAENG